ncbi:hypothetical protein GCM10010321_77370 [Streptomyces chartreusis]|nr:hypothetical protein GCM10010321_77370 [Streptomyces chartreusis]
MGRRLERRGRGREADGAATGTRDGAGRPTEWRRGRRTGPGADGGAAAGTPGEAGGRGPGAESREPRGLVAGYDVGSWNMPHFSSWLFASTSERNSPAPQSFSSP